MAEEQIASTPAEPQDSIELLYKYYGILADSSENNEENINTYKEILKASKGTSNEKKLAGQFIPRFFSRFPNLADEAINSHFDLCEDIDLSTRKQAIKELPTFCRQCKEYTKRVSDILAQLLQATETNELMVVRSSLLTLFNIEPKAAFLGIFNQIKNGDDRVREKCIEFIVNEVKELDEKIFTVEVEDTLVSEIKTVLEDASADEISIFYDLLVWTRLGKTPAGKKQILAIILAQIETEKPLNTDDEYVMERFIAFVKTTKKLFSADIPSNQLFAYFCKEVVPKFQLINGCNEGSGNALEVLKLLAEIAFHVKNYEDVPGAIDAIFLLLLEYLPLPAGDNGFHHQELQFSYVECLLFTMHHLLKENPTYLLSGDVEKLKDFRTRLQYFARTSIAFVRTLDPIVKKEKREEESGRNSLIKEVALHTISNVTTLIKDFFHNPPAYKANITFSWQSVKRQTQKRKMSSESSHEEKHSRPGKSFHQEIYQPPSGKYSSSFFAGNR